jgi:alkanesulfonate monooxygenase SsuD/methylene tetrahydromethanopterin reductase-like flavin-dependent oxidoreductase (luciferase family)
MAVSFGIFDHIDKQTHQPLSGTYADRLRVLELADQAGFYSYHLAEHHATPLCMAAQPSLFLAALSQRTKQLRFGPLVYLLPLYHPLRIIEEVCMLDQLSSGRLELGVGRGISPIELRYMGVIPEESRDIFQETLDILLRGLQTKRLTYNGKFHQLDNVPIEFEPVQKPHPPIWYPSSAPDRVAWIAERGFNSVLPGGVNRTRLAIDTYWDVWSKTHSSNEPRPKVGVMRTIFLADSDDEAYELAAPNFRQHYESLVKLWREHHMTTAAQSFTPDLNVEIHEDMADIGTPATVRERMAAFIDTTGCEYVVVRPMFGNLPVERVLYSMGLFINEVMPALAPAAVSA